MNSMHDFSAQRTNLAALQVETVGDAFLCASGIPDAIDSVEGAELAAHMALDMIMVSVASQA